MKLRYRTNIYLSEGRPADSNAILGTINIRIAPTTTKTFGGIRRELCFILHCLSVTGIVSKLMVVSIPPKVRLNTHYLSYCVYKLTFFVTHLCSCGRIVEVIVL